MDHCASTVVSALSARSAMGQEYASTVVIALIARSAVGLHSASTVVNTLGARSAVGRESASTVVGAVTARSAVGHQSASTVVGALHARSAGRTNDIGSKTKAKQTVTVVHGASINHAVDHLTAEQMISRLYPSPPFLTSRPHPLAQRCRGRSAGRGRASSPSRSPSPRCP